MSDISYERRKAVANAWKNEKSRVMEGNGTRDWSKKEQTEILLKGKATGYQGHHMKSVDGHNSKAGDSENIQFLTRKEHLAAHGGDYHNNTNGYYDPVEGKMHDFGRNKAHVDSRTLSNPLNEKQKKAVMSKASRADALKRAEEAKARAKKTEARKVNKSKSSSEKKQSEKTRSDRHVQSKTLAKQRTSGHAKSSETKVQSKTLAAQRSNTTAGTSSGKGVSSGKSASSGRGTAGSHGNGSGNGASHKR